MKSYVCTYINIAIIIFLYSCNTDSESSYKKATRNELKNLAQQADSLYRINEYGLAIQLFNEIIMTDSSNGELFFKRGYCEAQMYQYHNSSRDYLKAVELGYKKGKAYFNLGCVNVCLHNDSLALKYFIKSHEIDPGNEIIKREINLLKNELV